MPLRLRKTGSGKFGKRRGWGSATPTEYKGDLYDSKAEAMYAARLDERMKFDKDVVGWDRQQRWPLKVNGVKVCTIIPDFVVWVKDEDDESPRMELHEVKGFETAIWKLKRRLFNALHPEIPYIVIPAREILR